MFSVLKAKMNPSVNMRCLFCVMRPLSPSKTVLNHFFHQQFPPHVYSLFGILCIFLSQCLLAVSNIYIF